MVRHRANDTVYHAIADPTRRRMLDLLGERDRTVTELCRPFRMSQPAVSQHLRVLREAGLVSQRRVGRERHYRLEAIQLAEVFNWVAHYRKFWKGKLKKLGDFLDKHS